MPETTPEDPGFRKIVPLTRVQFLTDALFALSMMIILTQVDYPDPALVTSDAEIKAFLIAQLPAIEVYTITFILIAIYWVKHMEQFSYIREINYRLLWLQLGFLLFLVLLPVLIEPITAASAIGVSLWNVEAGQAALLAIPLAFAAQRWRTRRKAKQAGD